MRGERKLKNQVPTSRQEKKKQKKRKPRPRQKTNYDWLSKRCRQTSGEWTPRDDNPKIPDEGRKKLVLKVGAQWTPQKWKSLECTWVGS